MVSYSNRSDRNMSICGGLTFCLVREGWGKGDVVRNLKLYLFIVEWEQSSGRVLTLRDDDSQSVIDGEWRKINTLSHYKVNIR